MVKQCSLHRLKKGSDRVMKQPFLEETHNKPASWSKGGSHLCEAEWDGFSGGWTGGWLQSV